MTQEPSLSDLLDEEPKKKGEAPSLGDDDEPDADDADGSSPEAQSEVGQQMLDAVKANDPLAMYKAMKACIEME
jgi:hypothetical protein